MSKKSNGQCEICLLANGKEPGSIIFENEYITAYLDPSSISAGSVIVTTKKHFFDIDELDEVTAAAVMKALKTIAKAIKKVFKPGGIGFIHNSGEFSDLPHFHVHIFPRYKNDWLVGMAIGFPFMINTDTAEVAKELKEAI